MATPDLTAPSAQGRSADSEEARELGRKLYRRIVVDRDSAALRQLQDLAQASEAMELPVELRSDGGRGSRLKAALTAVGTLLPR